MSENATSHLPPHTPEPRMPVSAPGAPRPVAGATTAGSPDSTDSPVSATARDLVARGLVMRYGSDSTAPPALGGVDLRIEAGETVAVMGPSGSGKTTLLHVLAGIVRPTEGQVLWRGRDVARLGDADRTTLRRKDFGFVFQQGMLLPELPAVENVALPLLIDGARRAAALARAAALFAPLGLAGYEKRRPGELSGGQAQRVAIARALVAQPGVVFADEPTGALDQTTSAEVMGHLTALVRHTGASLVLVTHDENVAAWCSRVVSVRDGRVVGNARTGTTTLHPAGLTTDGALR
jgi:putative ABC transport system ATP-binding protein